MNARGFRSMSVTVLLLGAAIAILAVSAVTAKGSNSRATQPDAHVAGVR